MRNCKFILGIFAACLMLSTVTLGSSNDELRKVKSGAVVPAYRMTAVDGRIVDSTQNKGKVVVLVYLSAEQHSSELVASDADRLVKKFAKEDVELAFVTADVVYKSSLAKHWEQAEIAAPLAFDAERSLYDALGLVVLPTTVVVDKEGRLAHVLSGRRSGYFPLLDILIRHALGKIDDAGLEEELRTRSFGVGSGARAARPDKLRKVALGALVPTYQFTSLDGTSINSNGLKGKVVLLVYLSAGQRNSDRAAADAERVFKRLENDDLRLVFVTADVGQKEHFGKIWSEQGISTTLSFDAGRKLYGELGLIAFPTTLVIDRTGRLQHVITTRKTDYAHVLDAYAQHTLGLMNDEALLERLEAGSLDRGSPQALALRHRAAARLMRDKGMVDGAERELRTALELDPANIHIKLDLADLYLAISSPEESLEIVDAVLEKDPRHRRARLLRGIALYMEERLDEAEVVLKDALVLNPDPARTHYYLGLVYERKGDKDKAIEHYREALSRFLDE